MVIYLIERFSPKTRTASTEQQSGDRLLTTPIIAREIDLVHTKFIMEPIEPYTDLKTSGLILQLSISR